MCSPTFVNPLILETHSKMPDEGAAPRQNPLQHSLTGPAQ